MKGGEEKRNKTKKTTTTTQEALRLRLLFTSLDEVTGTCRDAGGIRKERLRFLGGKSTVGRL